MGKGKGKLAEIYADEPSDIIIRETKSMGLDDERRANQCHPLNVSSELGKQVQELEAFSHSSLVRMRE
jgi:hypothetical protein